MGRAGLKLATGFLIAGSQGGILDHKGDLLFIVFAEFRPALQLCRQEEVGIVATQGRGYAVQGVLGEADVFFQPVDGGVVERGFALFGKATHGESCFLSAFSYVVSWYCHGFAPSGKNCGVYCTILRQAQNLINGSYFTTFLAFRLFISVMCFSHVTNIDDILGGQRG